jgi:hypothetical protein
MSPETPTNPDESDNTLVSTFLERRQEQLQAEQQNSRAWKVAKIFRMPRKKPETTKPGSGRASAIDAFHARVFSDTDTQQLPTRFETTSDPDPDEGPRTA